MARPDVLLFDLFGTLVFFDDASVPRMEVAGHTIAMTIAGLPELVEEGLPGVAVVDFLRELRRTSAVMAAHKRAAGVEIPTRVRFERTLEALGAGADAAGRVAREMATRHMDTLARSVVCPPGRRRLLEGLAGEHRLALLSNFDDGATARRVLAEAGLASIFEAIVVSEEEGLRKPNPEIFHRACRRLDAAPERCLYVGDTLVEDVEGATAAGLGAVWIRASSDDKAHPDSPALAVLGDVGDLPAWLAAR